MKRSFAIAVIAAVVLGGLVIAAEPVRLLIVQPSEVVVVKEVVPLGQIILFQNENLRGEHMHIFTDDGNLDSANSNFGNKASSFVIVDGYWAMYANANYSGERYGPFGPGVYRNVDDYGVPNNKISSIRLVEVAD